MSRPPQPKPRSYNRAAEPPRPGSWPRVRLAQGFERVGTRAGAGVRASGGCPDTVWWWSTRPIADLTTSADAERKNPGLYRVRPSPGGESHKSRIPQDPVYREPSCDEIAVESNILAHIHVMQTLDHDLTPRNATTMGRDD